MKIDKKQTIQLFLLLGLGSFLLLLGQLIFGIIQHSLPAGVILIRIMVLVVVSGLIVFLWWLSKEADY
jgi:hypothetical protein